MPTPEKNSDLDDLIEQANSLKDAPSAETPNIPEALRKPVIKPPSDTINWNDDKNPGDRSGMMKALALGMNFVYAVVAAGAIGWALERWLIPSAKPWLLIGGLVLGLCAGMYLFIREANRVNRS